MGCGGSTSQQAEAEDPLANSTQTKSTSRKYETKKDNTKGDVEKDERAKRRAEMHRKMREESKLASELAPYLSWHVLKRCSGSSKVSANAEYNAFPGVIVFVDISGYTPLSDALGRLENMFGVELLAKFINEYFDELIQMITEHGGAVERFAGDALICLFASTSQRKKFELHTLTERAVLCSLAIQEMHGKFVARVSDHVSGEADKILTVHIGIGVSDEIKAINVGGLGDSWRRLIFGSVFDQQLLHSVDAAAAGQVCIANEGLAHLERSYLMAKRYVVVTPANARTPEGEGKSSLIEFNPPHTYKELLQEGKVRTHPLYPIKLTNSMERAVRGFVDLFVLSRIESGHTKISESRCLSMLFVTINNWGAVHETITSPYGVGFFSVHQLFRSIQGIVYRYEGCIANSLVDEKGCHIIITYGIPQHSDDPLLAVKSALEIKDRCVQLNFGVSIAVTTGDTYIGTIGSAQRKDYTIMGAAVNLCARLTSKCADIATADHVEAGHAAESLGKKWGMVLVDERTYSQTKKAVEYRTDLGTTRMKGYEEPVQLYSPTKLLKGAGRTMKHGRSSQGVEQDGEQIRAEERIVVETASSEQLAALESVRDEVCRPTDKTKPRVRPVVITGGSGCGKSYLIRVVLDPVLSGDVPGLILESGTSAGQTDFASWEPVFTQMFSSPLLGFNPGEQNRSDALKDFLTQVFVAIEQTAEMMELGYLMWATESFVTLLNPVLGTTFPETRDTMDAGQHVVKATTVTLLVALLKYFSRMTPLCIWIDMGEEMMDPQSMNVLTKVLEDRSADHGLLLLLCCRPIDVEKSSSKAVARAMKKIEAMPVTVNLELPSLDEQRSMELLRVVLNSKLQVASGDEAKRDVSDIQEVDEGLAQYVYKSSQQGRLFLVLAIVTAFKDELLTNTETSLCITNKKLHLRDADTGNFKLKLPDSVTHFATSLVDRLEPTQQLIVQCASVEGVSAVFPLQKSQGAMLGEILQLVDKRVLLEVSSDGLSDMYRFSDIVVRDAAYSMVLKDERERMHKQLAEYWEGIMHAAMQQKSEDDEEGDDAVPTPLPDSPSGGMSPQHAEVQQRYVASVARHWLSAVLYGKERRTIDEVDRAIWAARRHAKLLHDKHDYLGASDILKTLTTHLYPLAKSKRKAADEPLEGVMLKEVESTWLVLRMMWHARERFAVAEVMYAQEHALGLGYDALPDEHRELQHRALCGLAVESARLERYAQAHKYLDEAAGVAQKIDANHIDVLQLYTRVCVCQNSLTTPIREFTTLCTGLISKVRNEPYPLLDTLAQPNYRIYFTGVSSGAALADAHVALHLGRLLMLDISEGYQIGTTPDFNCYVRENESDPNFLAGVNWPRARALLCLDAALRRNRKDLEDLAGKARDEASASGDALAVMMADFFLAISRGAPEEAVPELRGLTSCMGAMAPFKAVLLEAVVGGPQNVKQYLEFLLRPPQLQGLYAPEILRLQGALLVRAAADCLGKAATLLRYAYRRAQKAGSDDGQKAPGDLENATRSAMSVSDIFRLAGGEMVRMSAERGDSAELKKPEVLMSEVFYAAEARFIAAVVLAAKGGAKLFLVRALSSLVDFWSDTGVLPGDIHAALAAIAFLLDEAGGQASQHVSQQVLDQVDSYTVEHGLPETMPELAYRPHPLGRWLQYAGAAPRLPGASSVGSVHSFGSSN